MPPVSKFTESERQRRKREAARLRQQRCRARKRERNRKNSFVTVDAVKKRTRCDSFAATSKQELATEMAEDSSSPLSASSSWDLLLKPTMYRGETHPSPKVTHSNAPASYPVHSISPCSTLNFPLCVGETSDANRSINTIHINKSNNKLPLVPSLSALEPKSIGIDEHERTAINIIMSLRHSPVFNLSVNPRFTSSSNNQVSK